MTPTTPHPITRYGPSGSATELDLLAVEEPLEIRVGWGPAGARQARALSITMRTPGDDLDLAVGFLFTEGIVRRPGDVWEARHCGLRDGAITSNTVLVELREDLPVDLKRLERHFYTTSSCGVCGKTSLEAVAATGLPELAEGPVMHPSVLPHLPDRLREAQAVFDHTGGLHAAGLFDRQGALLAHAEDVGRHNAMDKLVGHHLRQGLADLSDGIVVWSGRASFELVQKALMARVGLVAAVGAPSSLAVSLAAAHGMTLLGFVRHGRFNVYTRPDRVAVAS